MPPKKKSYPSGTPRAGAGTDNKSYPQAPKGSGDIMDNRGIWVNGARRGWSTLEDSINDRVGDVNHKISNIDDEIASYHTKKVKEKLYWYRVQEGVWSYVGKEDPRPMREAEKACLKLSIKKINADMNLCVIKKQGSHLIIDLALFKKHNSKKLPNEVLVVSELLKCSKKE